MQTAENFAAHQTTAGDTADELTPEQAAERIGCSKRTLARIVARQELPVIRISLRIIRFRLQDVLEYRRAKLQSSQLRRRAKPKIELVCRDRDNRELLKYLRR